MTSERTKRVGTGGVRSVSAELQHLCNGAATVFEEKSAPSNTLDVFDSTCAPDIHLRDYLIRVVSYVPLDEAQFLLAIEYLDRYLCTRSDVLSPTSVHRLVAVAMVLAHKFDSDFPLSDVCYGRILGIPHPELMDLQMIFMKRLQYRLMYPDMLRDIRQCAAR